MDIAEYMQGDLCRRVVLDEVMDGYEQRMQCEDGEEMCDICRHAHRTHIPSSSDAASINAASIDAASMEGEEIQQQRHALELPHQQMQQRRQKEALENRTLIDQLEMWSGICPWCLVRRCPDATEHTLAECTDARAYVVQGIQDQMKRGIRFANYSGCFNCGTPQSICQRWQAQESGGKWMRIRDGPCQYGSVVFESMASIAVASPQDVAIKEIIEGYLQGEEWIGVDTTELPAMCKVWGQRVTWGEFESNKFIQGFFHMSCQIAALACPNA